MQWESTSNDTLARNTWFDKKPQQVACLPSKCDIYHAKRTLFYHILFLAHLLVLVDRDKLANNVVLPLEHLVPALQRLRLLWAEVLELVQRTVEILGQHLSIEAVASKTAGGVTASEVGIGASRAVKVPATRDIKDLTADGHEHGHVAFAVEGQQGSWGVGLEDGRGGVAGKSRRFAGLKEKVGGIGDDTKKYDVEGREQAAVDSY